jgi:Holliday junction resolvasome RuvABC endonuclease subunit
MFVLGVDPGLSRCGYGCVEQRGRTQRHDSGRLEQDSALQHEGISLRSEH